MDTLPYNNEMLSLTVSYKYSFKLIEIVLPLFIYAGFLAYTYSGGPGTGLIVVRRKGNQG